MMTDKKIVFWFFLGWGGGRGYVPSVNRLLFLMNVCTAFDYKKKLSLVYFWESKCQTSNISPKIIVVQKINENCTLFDI